MDLCCLLFPAAWLSLSSVYWYMHDAFGPDVFVSTCNMVHVGVAVLYSSLVFSKPKLRETYRRFCLPFSDKHARMVSGRCRRSGFIFPTSVPLAKSTTKRHSLLRSLLSVRSLAFDPCHTHDVDGGGWVGGRRVCSSLSDETETDGLLW